MPELTPLNLMPRLRLGNAVDHVVTWLQDHCSGFFDAISHAINDTVDWLASELLSLPIIAVVVVLTLIALVARGWQTAVLAAVGFLLIDSFNQWSNAMQTLALIVVAGLIAVLLSVPLGILAAKSRIASLLIRPVLDFMQTLPAFVYLLPTLFLFGLGYATATLATIVFAMPPGVRLTELGIRQVDAETVEAGHAFGATPGRILRGVQIPLAMPTIMAGVNQVIMLALSMVVIGGMVGAEGLGGSVVQALSTLDIPLGAEAGVSVVILAIYLDRVTAGLGGQTESGLARLRRLLRRPRPATATA
jgi:glycine betaine/proline transport system permease protein